MPPGAYTGLMRDLDKGLAEPAEDAEAHVLGAHGGSREQGDNITLTGQTASQHYLPPWGMKPTVLDPRNVADLHTFALIH